MAQAPKLELLDGGDLAAAADTTTPTATPLGPMPTVVVGPTASQPNVPYPSVMVAPAPMPAPVDTTWRTFWKSSMAWDALEIIGAGTGAWYGIRKSNPILYTLIGVVAPLVAKRIYLLAAQQPFGLNNPYWKG